MDDPTFTTAEGSFKKINNLWNDDADVIFCAGKSAFRVYRGILCAQSQVFKDMFSLPQGETEVQNTPRAKNKSFTVIYAPDDEEDLYYFFLAIFYTSFYPRPPSNFPLHVTISIFRLAHKYDVAPLVFRAAEYLEFFFPLHRRKLLAIAAGQGDDFNVCNAVDLLPMLLRLLEIAHIPAINWIVPCVILVMVTRYETKHIMEHDCYSCISPEMKSKIVVCSTRRAVNEATRNAWVNRLPARNCINHTACCQMAKIVGADTLTSADRYVSAQNAAGLPGSGQRFCYSCQEAGRGYLSQSEDMSWSCYPRLCGFGSWNDVIIQRETKMEELRSLGNIDFNTMKFPGSKSGEFV